MPIEQIKFLSGKGKFERPPVLDRIVSERMSEEEKQEIVGELFDKFERQEIKEIRENEIELSLRQKELIVEASRLIFKALKGVGIEMRTEIIPSMIHLVRPEAFEEYGKKKGIKAQSLSALASIEEQAILIKAKEYDELKFLDIIIHEMLHLNSFVSLQAVDVVKDTENIGGIVERRTGLRIKEIKRVNGKKVAGQMFFNELDEAVIEKLTVDIIRNFEIRISSDLKSDFEKSEKLRKILIKHIQKVFKEKGNQISQRELLEIGNLDAILNWQAILLPEAAGFLKSYEESSDSLILEQAINFYLEEKVSDAIPHFSYGSHRIMFEKLVDSIFNKNKEKFNSSRDVAILFIKALFEGSLLPLVRVIEKTFGKGSFKKLGEGKDLTQEEF